jgi:hypothetical protein
LSLTETLEKHLGDPMEWFGASELPPQVVLLSLAREVLEMPSEAIDDFYQGLVASDSYFLAGRLREALDVCPSMELGSRWTLLSNKRLNLLHANAADLAAKEALALFPKRLTTYGTQNVEQVAVIIEQRIRDMSQNGGILPSVVEAEGAELATRWLVYNGTVYSKYVRTDLPCYEFSRSKGLRATIDDLSRLAENTLREEAGLPNVGEGWLAETQLLRELQNALPELRVEQHASPDWLGRQHLDIFFPDILVAVEYQGAQHLGPVDYFGGEPAFVMQQKRDRRKKVLCTRHGVVLLHVHPGYDLSALVMEVAGIRAGAR